MPPPTRLSTEQLIEIDRRCLEFEKHFRRNAGTSIELHIEDAIDDFREELLRQLVLVEVELLNSLGETPQFDEFVARFPNDFAVLKSLQAQFPAKHVCQTTIPNDQDLERSGSSLASNNESESVEHSAQDRLPVLSDYVLTEKLASGGMGVVFRAKQKSLGREVAVKLILPDQLTNDEMISRFKTEAEAAARLDHPNIVPIYDVGYEAGRHFYSMKLIEGVSLHEQRMERNADDARSLGSRPFDWEAKVAQDLADALAYAHDRGVLHRDVKPSNIMLAPDGTLYLTDFGLAKLLERQDSQLTTTAAMLGSPSYMSPEQATGNASRVTTATDVYGIGAVLYFLLTGRPPFKATSIGETVKQVIEEPPQSPARLNPSSPTDLVTICLKCLEKSPTNRYRSAATVAEELRRYRNNEPIQARPVSDWERGLRWCQRHPAIAGMTAALIASLALGLGVALIQWQQTTDARNTAELIAEQRKIERDVARGEEYRAKLQLCEFALRSGNLAELRRALASTPADFRGWEWKYYASQLDQSTHQATHPSKTWPLQLTFDEERGKLIHRSRATNSPWMSSTATWSADDLSQFATTQELRLDSSDLSATLTQDEQGRLLVLHHSTKQLLPPALAESAEVPLAISPGGMFVLTRVVTENNQGVRLWRLPEALPITFFAGAQADDRFPPFNKDGTRLLLRQGVEGGEYRLIDTNDGKLVTTLQQEQRSFVRSFAFSPDGTLLATAHNYPQSTVRVWESSTGKLLHEFNEHLNTVFSVAFSNDNRWLASGSQDNTVGVYSLETGEPKFQFAGHTSNVTTLAFHPSNNSLATGADDHHIFHWDLITGEVLHQFRGHQAAIRSLCFGQSGEQLWSADEGGSVRRFALQNTNQFQAHASYVYSVKMMPDGRRFATAGWDNKLKLWDHDTLSVIREFTLPSAVLEVGFASPETIVACCADNRVYVWDLTAESEEPIASYSCGIASTRVGVGIATCLLIGQFAFPGTEGITVVTHGDWTNPFVVPNSLQSCSAIAYSQDGSRLYANQLNDLCVYDTDGFKEVDRLEGHSRMLTAVEPVDATRLYSASLDGTLRVWDLRRKTSKVLVNNTVAYDLALAPDGERLAAANEDRTLSIIDTQRNYVAAKLAGHESYVHGVDFSMDGKSIVTSSGDTTVRLWKVNPEMTLDTAPN